MGNFLMGQNVNRITQTYQKYVPKLLQKLKRIFKSRLSVILWI